MARPHECVSPSLCYIPHEQGATTLLHGAATLVSERSGWIGCPSNTDLVGALEGDGMGWDGIGNGEAQGKWIGWDGIGNGRVCGWGGMRWGEVGWDGMEWAAKGAWWDCGRWDWICVV